ncbi:MAG: hypothetical protein O9262_04910 [Cyclobacteriaceae bacterium]|nr:hypothetical protein [Cyclobacteriaceae bacterium]
MEVIQIGDGGNQTYSVEDLTENWFMVDNHTEAESHILYSRIKVTSSKLISGDGEKPQYESAWTQPYIFH